MKFFIILCTIYLNIYALNVPSALVDSSWLYKNLKHVKILDVRKQIDNYKSHGHIKDAILVNNKEVRVTRTIKNKLLTRVIPSQKNFDNFIAKHSINTNDTIIITHEGRTPGNLVAASRLYWQFKVYGYDNVAILDGGNKSWFEESLDDISKEIPEKILGDFKTNKTNHNIIASITDVKNALKTKNKILIDTRSLRFHIGLEKRPYVRKYGHIPNTKHFPFKFLTPLKGTNKYFAKDKLIALFQRMNINPFKPIILYCNSGFEASSVWFALYEIIGNKNVSIYDASLHEWTQDESNMMSLNLSTTGHKLQP
jgi:thiosulfate/3-mercaptopyruvate sulfurtransferase